MDHRLAVWWQPEPLNEAQTGLFHATIKAHAQSAFRENASSVAVVNAADSSGDLVKAIMAGLATLGERHAPIEQTYLFLNQEHPEEMVTHALVANSKVPGWGGTFQKHIPDPFWAEVDRILSIDFKALHQKISAVTEELHTAGKNIFPNPSAYTAATAMAVGLKAKLASHLFVWGRLSAWSEIAAKYL